jgi:hypothetical protein
MCVNARSLREHAATHAEAGKVAATSASLILRHATRFFLYFRNSQKKKKKKIRASNSEAGVGGDQSRTIVSSLLFTTFHITLCVLQYTSLAHQAKGPRHYPFCTHSVSPFS